MDKVKKDLLRREAAVNYVIDGKKNWNELYGGVLSQARYWRIVALLLAVSSLILAGGFIWSTRQSHLIPYAIEYDSLGKTRIYGRVQSKPYDVNQVILTHTIANFVRNVRSIVGDPIVEKTMLAKAYSHLNPSDPAYTLVTNFIRHRNIPQISTKLTVAVKIHTVLWKSPTTAMVKWTETAYLLDGQQKNLGDFAGFVKVKIVAPKNVSDNGAGDNPLGIYVQRLSWSREQ